MGSDCCANVGAPNTRPYFVIILSIVIALYFLIAGVVLNPTINEPAVTVENYAMGIVTIVVIVLLAIAMIICIVAICMDKHRQIMNVVIFCLLFVSVVVAIADSTLTQLFANPPLPVIPSPAVTATSTAVALILGIGVLLIPCFDREYTQDV